MESLQIRLPKSILTKVDQLISAGFYRSRSELLRVVLQDFLMKSEYNGMAPFIVGPFNSPDFLKVFDLPFENFVPDPQEVNKEQQKWKYIKVPK